MEKMLGVMIDCSRNAVLKVEMVKLYADVLKKMGYNTLLLDKLDTPGGKHLKNPSKYILYNDPFMGLRDSLCAPEDSAYLTIKNSTFTILG